MHHENGGGWYENGIIFEIENKIGFLHNKNVVKLNSEQIQVIKWLSNWNSIRHLINPWNELWLNCSSCVHLNFGFQDNLNQNFQSTQGD